MTELAKQNGVKNLTEKELRQIFCPALTDQQFMAFQLMATHVGADISLKEIAPIDFGGRVSYFVSRDFYRRKAQEQANYNGMTSAAVFQNDIFEMTNGVPTHKFGNAERGKIVGAYCTVFLKNIAVPFTSYVIFAEYSSGKSTWVSKPATMIEKVAQAQAFRGAFQGLFQNTYDESEKWFEDNPKDNPKETPTVITVTPSELEIEEALIKLNSAKTLPNLQTVWKGLGRVFQQNLSVIDAKDAKKDWLSQPQPESIDDLVVDAEFIESENELLANLAKCKTTGDWEFIIVSAIKNAPYLNNDSTIAKVEELKLTKKLK